jgi:DNA invertase Pin-like site-specific DNA recombinase
MKTPASKTMTLRLDADTRSRNSMNLLAPLERPGFSRLEREIAAGNVSTVAVWRLDRLGRTAKGLTGAVR